MCKTDLESYLLTVHRVDAHRQTAQKVIEKITVAQITPFLSVFNAILWSWRVFIPEKYDLPKWFLIKGLRLFSNPSKFLHQEYIFVGSTSHHITNS